MSRKFDSQFIQDIFIIDSDKIYETQMIQQCFDIVEAFVVAIDPSGNVTLINRKGKELLGIDKKEVIGENFIEKFIDIDKQEKTQEIFRSVMNEGSSYSDKTNYHLRTNANEIRIIEARNITINDKNGKIVGIIISGKDVTGYVKRQQNLQKDVSLYRILANNIPDINLYLFDKDLHFILAEGSEMKNNGFASHHFEGKHLKDIPNDTLRNLWKPLLTAALKGDEISSDYKFNNYYYLIWVLPIKNERNEIYSGVIITQNVTDERITEQELKKSKEAADDANRAKSEFLARVSHEIRTPLNAILGFTEQLEQTNLDKKQIDYLNIIDKSSEHLLSLINDILILSKIEASQINFDNSPFKIEYAVKYVYNALKVKAEEKDLRFSYDVDKKLDKVLLGDSFRLRQILINLLNNAIKFTNSGYVELRCFLLEELDNELRVRFDIIDTGIGISSENLESIFEQFNQADSSITKKYGGTGLGLTICKNLIELQHGSLSVTSQKNTGSTFSFVLPFKKGKENDIIPADAGIVDKEKLRNIKVLLVDDDSVNRLLGKTILEKFNCSFDIANNGKEAVSVLDDNTYDIILLDIHLPDISGIEVARYLRREKQDASTKIVAVTAAVMNDDIKEYYKAGINDFIIKPFKEIHLFNKMCEILEIKNQSSPESKVEIILKEEISPRLYNLDELEKMTGSNADAMINMLNTFIENSEDSIHKFQQFLKEKDWKQIGETAHKILPSYKHLEVNSIISELKDIKIKTLVELEINSVPSLVKKVIKKMSEVVSALNEEVDQRKN